MIYDLRREPWIPWRRRSGAVEWGPPAALVSRMTGPSPDPVVAIAAPRPDFRGALEEFLIGLLTAALQPEDTGEWFLAWGSPPSVERLQEAMDALPNAFDLLSDGPRFFQDSSEAECRAGEQWSVESLLIDSPGSTFRDAARREITTDLFAKAGRVGRLSRPAAAMAVLTLQTYAPEGGRGHLTSMRGGGPLTTLVEPRSLEPGGPDDALWLKLWANVETVEQLEARMPSTAPPGIESAFPWLAPTVSSDPPQNRTTSPSDAHPLQAYFGLPRRIRLEAGDAGTCDLTGATDTQTSVAFWMKTYGARYRGWKHPLSPYSESGSNREWLPVHGRGTSLSWRDWIGLTLRDPRATARPAQCVSAFVDRARRVGIASYRVHAFGYDTDHKKACAWTESALPAFAVDDAREQRLHRLATEMAEATSLAGTALLGSVKQALFQSPDDAKGDLARVRAELWSATERTFYDVVRAVADQSLDLDAAADRATEHTRAYIRPLAGAALSVFDRWCPPDGLRPEALRRRVSARYGLVSTLSGHGKLGDSIFRLLDLAPPGDGRQPRQKKTRTRERTA